MINLFWVVMALVVYVAWCSDRTDALSRRITDLENESRDWRGEA